MGFACSSVKFRNLFENSQVGIFRTRISDGLIFEVEDTGPGIAPEEIDILFDAFVQTETGRKSQQGTGLELAISRKFVKMMGGDITVRSRLDEVLDKVKGFAVGGRDYITKPFQLEEVVARIENQLTIRNLQKQLQEQNQVLQQEIRDRQKAEQALRVFLHSISHDLRNPVTGMLMVLKNLLNRPWSVISGQSVASGVGSEQERTTDTGQGTIPLRSTLERMATSCDRQLNLINSLVESHEYEVWGVPLQCQPLLLHTLTQKLIEEWQPILTSNQATLKNLVSAELPPLCADPNQLWRVFSNLIANALKHNPPGITLTLSAEVTTADSQELKAQERESTEKSKKVSLKAHQRCNQKSKLAFIRCCVTDDGVGMTPDQSKCLFELYTRITATRRTAGLGLGLYLCRQIITAHGGDIGVMTRPGCGATFWFTLPVSAMDNSEESTSWSIPQ